MEFRRVLFRSVDLSGERLYNVAKYAATLGAQYEFALSGGSSLRIGADARFRGNTKVGYYVRSKAFTTADALLRWASADPRWAVPRWVQPLTEDLFCQHRSEAREERER